MALSFLPVDEVKTLGLNLTVDKGTGESGQELLGSLVALGLAYSNLLLVYVRE